MSSISFCAGNSWAGESVGAVQPDKRSAAKVAAVLPERRSDISVAIREDVRAQYAAMPQINGALSHWLKRQCPVSCNICYTDCNDCMLC